MTPSVRTLIVILLLAASGQPVVSQDAATADPAWNLLVATRNVLAQAPREIPFEQVFVPAGFSTGDRETGLASFDLPRCTRWDYRQPDPRSYLLCDDTVLAWNEGEESGRRLRLDGAESGAFELWLSPIQDLRTRYRAALAPVDRAHTVVRLEPIGEAEFTTAEILVDRESGLPLRFEYVDQEGSLTAFEFGASELLTAGDGRFRVPPLEWIDEEP